MQIIAFSNQHQCITHTKMQVASVESAAAHRSAVDSVSFLVRSSVVRSTAEPRPPLHQETDVKCLLRIWSSRYVTEELSSR